MSLNLEAACFIVTIVIGTRTLAVKATTVWWGSPSAGVMLKHHGVWEVGSFVTWQCCSFELRTSDEGHSCGAAHADFAFQRKELLWPEVTRECFLKVVALQLDQKNDWNQRGRVNRGKHHRQGCLSFPYNNLKMMYHIFQTIRCTGP